jgi:hypothetical protein
LSFDSAFSIHGTITSSTSATGTATATLRHSPSPQATPSAAVTQTVAAVVSPAG